MFSIDLLDSHSFSWRACYAASLCSDLVYQPPAAVQFIATNNWKFMTCDFVEVEDTQSFIAYSDKVIVVAFRGSESVADWLSNLDMFSATKSFGTVHRGFSDSFDVVRDRIAAKIVGLEPSQRQIVITGHSLGGALATLAAAEWASTFPSALIYTFGQPRVGKADFGNFAKANFSARLFRVVNDDDIVTRVPPLFQHVGTLFHLDESGNLKANAAESEFGSTEAPPLSEPEFQELKARIDVQRLKIRLDTLQGAIAAPKAEFEASALAVDAKVNASVEGLFPSISDHRMGRYIAAIRRLAFELTRMDGALEMARNFRAQRTENESVRSTFSGNRTELGTPVLIRLRNREWTAPAGVTIHSRLGKVVTAHCSDQQLELLSNDSNVASIEASRDAGIQECAVSMPFVGATNVHVPPLDERGDSAVIGVIDSGIDIMHEAFLDSNGSSRIIGIWNQREVASMATNTATPNGVNPNVFTQDYGVYYDAQAVKDMIAGIRNPSAFMRDPSTDGNGNPAPGHGTHVSSIAAGRAVGTFAGGVAPDAKLIAVIPNMMTNPGDPPSLGYSNSHVDALSFLIAAASIANNGAPLPIAVNVSLGMNAGAHDGLSTLEAAFDEATGLGRDQGVVIVKSAGNEGDSGGHAEVSLMNHGIAEISWESIAGRYRNRDYFEVWYDPFHDLEFTVIDPAGRKSQTVSSTLRSTSDNLGRNFCTLNLTLIHGDNGHNQLQITIVPNPDPIQFGEWKLEIIGRFVAGGDRKVHAWVERDPSRAIQFKTGDSNAMTISIPGTANKVITVSACESSLPLRRNRSSSRGLTRDGRAKPELCAPGNAIIAAASNSPDTQAVVPMTGTSMAAPHVTGAIALALSMRAKSGKNQFNSNQLSSILKLCSKGQTGVHNEDYGYGGLDVLAFINAVASHP